MSVENKTRDIVRNAIRMLGDILLFSLRCVVLLGTAWVCCWLSCMMWSWTVNEEMETIGPYYYSGFPIWLAKTAAHGSVGGGIYVPVREYLNTAVWFAFWLFVRGLLTGHIIGLIPASLIPVRRRMVFGLLMGALFCGFFILMAHTFFYQKWLRWVVVAGISVLIVVSLQWLRSGYVLPKRTGGKPIPVSRWIKFSAGVVFIILISVCFNKTLPAKGAPYVSSPWFHLVWFILCLIL